MFSATTVDLDEQGMAGPRFRMPLPGDETDFVQGFLRDGLPAALRGMERYVFVEPRIDGAFPDVVAVYWNPRVAAKWRRERAHLTKADLRLLHACYAVGCAEREALEGQLGKAPVRNALERLAAAGVLRKARSKFALRPLSEVFAVRRLIAVEAKIGDYRRGLMQAIQNTWFASDSYLLTRGRPREPDILELAQRTGVGIIGLNSPIDASPIEPHSDQLPRSYCSWLFNEWTWRLMGGADGVPISAGLAQRTVS